MKSKRNSIYRYAYRNWGLFILFLSVTGTCQGQPVWQPMWNWETSYDSIGQIVEIVESDYDFEYWSLNRRQELHYNEGLLSEKFTQYAESETWYDQFWITTTYDTSGHEILRYDQYWSTLDTQWADWGYRSKLYDENGRLTESTYESWFDDIHRPTSRNIYTYNGDELQLHTYEEFTNDGWISIYRWYFEYDSLGQNIEKRQQSIQWEMWRDLKRSIYIYDSYGLQIEELIQEIGVDWYPTIRLLKTYEGTNLVEVLQQNSYQGSWYSRARWTHYFDTENREFYQQKDVSYWIPSTTEYVPHLKPQIQVEPPFPNPFNPQTTIRYHLPTESNVKIEIYNIEGRMVRSLIAADHVAGDHERIWNGVDDMGDIVESGLYLVMIQSGKYQKTIRILYLK